ncbi:MAG: hypothetical protein JO281_21395 [Pseudonocardiales bacterium]|nr:hypothetical protein [Pseudonocardiales bacterium]
MRNAVSVSMSNSGTTPHRVRTAALRRRRFGVEQGKRKTGNELIVMWFLAGEGLLVACRPM